jgi:regulator of replication initiation timing
VIENIGKGGCFMPLMERDKFEEILNKLHGEIDHSEKTELLQELRVAQGNAYNEFDDFTKKVEKLSTDNNDLLLSNSKLFRQLEINKPEEKKAPEEKKKEFSETVTIEQLTKGV